MSEQAQSESAPATSQGNEEQTLFEAHPAMVRARPFLFLLILAFVLAGIATTFLLHIFSLAISVIAGFVLFWWWLQCKRTTLTVTNSRTRLRRGLLSKHTTEVWHHHVRNVQTNQNVFERIMGVGTISIASAGKSGFEVEMSGVPKVNKIKDIIDQNRMGGTQQGHVSLD